MIIVVRCLAVRAGNLRSAQYRLLRQTTPWRRKHSLKSFIAFANSEIDKGQPDQICWGALVRLVTDVAMPNVNVLPCSMAYTPFRCSGPCKEWTRLGLDVATGELPSRCIQSWSRLKIDHLLIVDLCSFFVLVCLTIKIKIHQESPEASRITLAS